MSKKKIFISIAVLLGVLVIGGTIYKASVTDASANGSEVYVKQEQVMKKDLSSVIYTTGVVQSKESVTLNPDVSGKVESVIASVGDKVQKGDVLATLDVVDLKEQLETAKLQLDISKMQLSDMKSNDYTTLEVAYDNAQLAYNDALAAYEDNKLLLESGAISQQAFNSVEASLKTAKNNLKSSKASLSNAKNSSDISIKEKQIQVSEISIQTLERKIENATLTSPIDGVLTQVNIKPGDVVNSSVATFVIQDLSNFEVVTNISEFDINQVEEDQLVKITGEGFVGEEYEGKVARINPSAVRQSNGQSLETVVEVGVDVIDNDVKFKPNFSVNLEIITKEKSGALVIPYEAIKKDENDDYYVFTISNKGFATKNAIKMGIQGDLKVEIISDSIREGDKVILNPSDQIQEGTKVKYFEE